MNLNLWKHLVMCWEKIRFEDGSGVSFEDNNLTISYYTKITSNVISVLIAFGI